MFWNPESVGIESGIQHPESGIHSVESRIWYWPELPYMGRLHHRLTYFIYLNDPNMSSMVVHQMFLFTTLLMDGGWSEWNSWSNCTKPVGGIQTRKRECTDPQLTHGWRHCGGTGAQLRECSNMSSCQEGNIQIAAFLISVDKNFYFETKLCKFRNKS